MRRKTGAIEDCFVVFYRKGSDNDEEINCSQVYFYREKENFYDKIY